MNPVIQGLLDPDVFPERPNRVKLVQTHISFVLITDDFVYKIKKPVELGFLDFSTIEKRRYYCHQEMELNSRFSHDLYMDVLPVLFDGKSYRIGKGGGEIVDYAVKMRRLSEDIIMKSMFERKELSEGHLRKIAEAVAGFHGRARRSDEIDRFGEPDVFKFTTDENFMQTEKYVGLTIDEKDFKSLRAWTDNYFINNRNLFLERIKSKKIRDCHGDLHMEHICLTDPVSIFDCIEFNDRLRYTDTLADIGFLLMDLEYMEGKGLSDTLWEAYAGRTGDMDMMAHLDFYKVYRAYVRGKVNSFQIDDEQIGAEEKEKAIRTARRYFRLARDYIS